MSDETAPELMRKITNAFGSLRAEYENDHDLYQRFAPPKYFSKLIGIAPTFLIGGRGTGKTTTLRTMSYSGQASVSGSMKTNGWPVIGAYWKVEPNVVSAFRGRGLDEAKWTPIFSHYLNLRLSALVVDFALWLIRNGTPVELNNHRVELFSRSLHLGEVRNLSEIANAIDISMVDIESKLNGSMSALTESAVSLLGRPLEYLFSALEGAGIARERPFMFCLDEYENLESYQQRILNTLIKQVGESPYTFKIGVRNTVAIDPSTLVHDQPLQDPADFTKVDIITDLKDESFEEFAATVVNQRLSLVDSASLHPSDLLPSISFEEEAVLLGADDLKDQLLCGLRADPLHEKGDLDYVRELPVLEAVLALRWAASHDESPLETVRWARDNEKKWKTRVVNYGYATLFTIRENRIGPRKYYAGWKTYCQLADGNIRYMIRLVHEAIQLHALDNPDLCSPVSIVHQTTASTRVGKRTVRDLQSWSRQGAALTRLSLGLGSVFAHIAREAALATPEVNQFRVGYSGSTASSTEVEHLLGEAVGQGVLIGFEGDKNARFSGATAEIDYQLHPVFAPFFVYSPRKKRRMVLKADDLIALTRRETAQNTIRRILGERGSVSSSLPDQLTLFSEM